MKKNELIKIIKECINEVNEDQMHIKRAWDSIKNTKRHIESVKLKMKKYDIK